MSKPEHRSLVGGSALTVDGEVYLDGLQTDGGRINFRGATLAGVVADGAQLDNPGDYSISLKQATVKGSVRLIDGFTSTGLVVLSRSTIEGTLQFSGGSFTCPQPVPDTTCTGTPSRRSPRPSTAAWTWAGRRSRRAWTSPT